MTSNSKSGNDVEVSVGWGGDLQDLRRTSVAPVEREKGWVTAKKDNQRRVCPLQGRRIVNERVARCQTMSALATL